MAEGGGASPTDSTRSRPSTRRSLRVKPAREPLAVDVKFKVKAHRDINVEKPVLPGMLTLMFDTPPVQNHLCVEKPVDSQRLPLPERR